MDIKDISTQLELVRECYHRVSSAHNFWIAYRRAAGGAARLRRNFRNSCRS